MHKVEPVAISGMGCISAAGMNLAETLAALDRGNVHPQSPPFSVAVAHPVFVAPLPVQVSSWGGSLPWPVQLGDLQQCNRTVHLAAHAASQALHQAGLTLANVAPLRVGVCIGTSVGASLDFFSWYVQWHKQQRAPHAGQGEHTFSPILHEQIVAELQAFAHSNPALAIAELFGFSGPVATVTNACSSGTDAIGIAAQWVRSGACDIALAGGADALAFITYLGFQSLQLMSKAPCTPFDSNRSGLSLGEGAGMVVLENEQLLRRRNRPTLGAVAGYGTCTDAFHLTAPHPEGLGLGKALQQALAQAGVSHKHIAFINAHGTATPTNDKAEGAFFQQEFAGTPFVATKGSTGHTLGAAGALEAVFTIAHLARQQLPASQGFTTADASMGVAPVACSTPASGTLGMSQSLAFGGNNSILLLSRGEASCA